MDQGEMDKTHGTARRISRVTRPRAAARMTYDRMSGWYDLLAGYWESKPRAQGLELLRVRSGERVLEIGFGTGHSLPRLARAAGPTGQVFGFDLSRGMCSVARGRIGHTDMAQRIGLAQGDAVHLPMRAQACDAIFLSFTLELFDTPEIPRVLAECHRVLRDGGRICIVALSKDGARRWVSRAYEWAHRTWPAVVDCRPIYVRSSLEEAGYTVGQVSRMGLAGLSVEAVVATKGD